MALQKGPAEDHRVRHTLLKLLRCNGGDERHGFRGEWLRHELQAKFNVKGKNLEINALIKPKNR